MVFLDDDVVVQQDLSPLWDVDLGGKVNGAVETCKGDDGWVMSKQFSNYFNFSHPLIAQHLNPNDCAWAYGMNVFDLEAWRRTNISGTYHFWLNEVTRSLAKRHAQVSRFIIYSLEFLGKAMLFSLLHVCEFSYVFHILSDYYLHHQ